MKINKNILNAKPTSLKHLIYIVHNEESIKITKNTLIDTT